jgi:membrane-associated phospholipid phosphatase
MHIFDEIGLYGPGILGISSLYVLREKPKYLFTYILAFSINIIVITILKLLFRHPRPNQDPAKFYAKERNSIIQFNAYGMPSGHAQSTVFSTVYIWLATKNYFITFLYASVSVLSMLQRVKYNFHTIVQIFVGLTLGIVIGYAAYIYAKKLIPGKLFEKPDDDGPL